MPNAVIDTHVHLWDPTRFTYPWHAEVPALNRPYRLDDLLEATDEVPLEAFVFMEADVAPGQRLDEVKWVAELAAEEPRLKGIVAAAALEKGDRVRDDLDRLQQEPLVRGIRRIYQAEPDLDFPLAKDFIAGVRALALYDFSFDICINWRYMESTLRFAGACDEVPMILDHIGKPPIADGRLDPWRRQMKELARMEHVICKLSGVATEADHATWTVEQLRPFILETVEAFGFDRLVFGGDWPVATLAIQYPRWIEVIEELLADANAEEMQKLFRDNAAAFYRIAV